MSDTPLTDAVTHLIRQRNDRTYETMLHHARRMESDRSRLMECLRLIISGEGEHRVKLGGGYLTEVLITVGWMPIDEARKLLRELEGK